MGRLGACQHSGVSRCAPLRQAPDSQTLDLGEKGVRKLCQSVNDEEKKRFIILSTIFLSALHKNLKNECFETFQIIKLFGARNQSYKTFLQQ